MSLDTGRAVDDRRHVRRIACRLIVLVVADLWGLITHGTFAGSGDEPHYMMIADSIAFDGDVDLANDYQQATIIGGGTLRPELHALPRGTHLRPVHDVGMPLVLAPVVAAAYVVADRLGDVLPAAALRATRLNEALLFRHQISLLMALLTALLARELFLVLRSLGSGRRIAFWSALLFACTPPALSHAYLFFTEIPTALIVLYVFRRLSVDLARPAASWMALGALTGFLRLVHARNIGLIPASVLIAIALAGRRKIPAQAAVIFVSLVGLGVIARCVTTSVLWGTLVITPHTVGAVSPATTMAMEAFVRGTGLLFDREHGLLGYAPIYLLAVPGMALLRVRKRIVARDALIVIACYIVPICFRSPTCTAGGAAGPRQRGSCSPWRPSSGSACA